MRKTREGNPKAPHVQTGDTRVGANAAHGQRDTQIRMNVAQGHEDNGGDHTDTTINKCDGDGNCNDDWNGNVDDDGDEDESSDDDDDDDGRR